MGEKASKQQTNKSIEIIMKKKKIIYSIVPYVQLLFLISFHEINHFIIVCAMRLESPVQRIESKRHHNFELSDHDNYRHSFSSDLTAQIIRK